MQKLWQLLPLFITGFLISRLVARTALAERLINWFFQASRGRFSLLVLGVMGAAAVLSLFIPNMLTVLVLLPSLEKLGEAIEDSSYPRQALLTPLTLALIYGANIGGMGSLVGSPANALMLGALELFQVPGREKVEFLSWLAWGIPLVVIFVLLAWQLLVRLLVSSKYRRLRLSLSVSQAPLDLHQRCGKWLGLLTACFWVLISSLSTVLPSWRPLWDGLSVLFGLLFVLFVFAYPLATAEGEKRCLLKFRDCYTGLPLRGILFAGIAVGLSGGLVLLGVPSWLARQVQLWFPSLPSPFWLYLVFTLLTIFSTELFSNTATSVALFPIAYKMSIHLGLHPLPAMMAVALSSTCAFMSPLATPVNGLAFGGIREVSLWKMLQVGFLVNLLGGVWLSWILATIIPLFYGLSIKVGGN